eukprot:359793-Chlamydomonas_euryale.AAC.23
MLGCNRIAEPSFEGDAFGRVVVCGQTQMRASIKALFPDRDCFALVRPCLEENDLMNMDKLPTSKLRPEFKQASVSAN